jgi:hypothetical protein
MDRGRRSRLSSRIDQTFECWENFQNSGNDFLAFEQKIRLVEAGPWIRQIPFACTVGFYIRCAGLMGARKFHG